MLENISQSQNQSQNEICLNEPSRLLPTSSLKELAFDYQKVGEDLMLDVDVDVDVQVKSPYVLVAKDKTYSLSYGENTIGRASSNTIVVNDPYVSRSHSVIVVHSDNKIEIFESSKNGTSVNNVFIAHSFLKVSDEIIIAPRSCNYKLVLANKNSFEKDQPIDTFGIDGSKRANTINSNSPTNSSSPSSSNNSNSSINSRNLNRQSSCHETKEHIFDSKAHPFRFNKVNNINRFNSAKGFSLIELLVVIAILGIISAISVLNIISSRRAANSASAVQSMRLISSSQSSYFTGVGNGDYATSQDLVREQFIDDSLAAATLPTPNNILQKPKSGYLFVFQSTASNTSTDTLASYQVSARPLLGNGFARAGDKSFFVDATGVIRVSPSAVAPFADSNSQPLN